MVYYAAYDDDMLTERFLNKYQNINIKEEECIPLEINNDL